jgi:hypothetical protein
MFDQTNRGANLRGETVTNITRLDYEEKVRLDSDRMAELYVQLGEIGEEIGPKLRVRTAYAADLLLSPL